MEGPRRPTKVVRQVEISPGAHGRISRRSSFETRRARRERFELFLLDHYGQSLSESRGLADLEQVTVGGEQDLKSYWYDCNGFCCTHEKARHIAVH